MSEISGGGHAAPGLSAPSTTSTGSTSLRDEVLVSTSQLQEQLLNAVDRIERSRSSPRIVYQQQPAESHPQARLARQMQLPQLVVDLCPVCFCTRASGTPASKSWFAQVALRL